MNINRDIENKRKEKVKLPIPQLVFFGVKLLLILLLLFGFHFTKINLAGPVYLYDALLLLLTFIASLGLRRLSEKNIILFLLLSLIYLVFSFVFNDAALYVIRQFMIAGYLLLTYIIFQSIASKQDDLLDFIFSLSKWSFILQMLFLIFSLLKGKSLFGDFNYLSPVSVMLLPVYAARVLTYADTVLKKVMQLGFILFVSTTLGHASAFLAVIMTIFGFFVFKINRKQLLISLGIIAMVLVSFYAVLPQFRDANASWRLFYWGIGIEKITDSYFMGNGFGVPYINDEEITTMINIFGNDNDFLDSPKERYVKAYHNSFLTLMFNMGICSFLLFSPFIRAVIFLKEGGENPKTRFLVLGFVGSATWCFFNVILELPHSSMLFWLLFLLTSSKLKKALS